MGRLSARPLRLVCVVLVAVVLAALAGFWIDKIAARDQQEAATLNILRHRAEALASSVAEQVRSLAFSVDLALLQMAAHFRVDRRIDDADLELLRAALPEDLLQTVIVVGADGFVSYASQPLAGPIWLGDSPAFRFHRESSVPALHIGSAVRHPLDGAWAIPFSRTLQDARGRFAGYISLSVKPSYLSSAFANITINKDDVIAMVHGKGSILARTPDAEHLIGQHVRGDRPYLQPGAPPFGWFRASGSFHDVERIYAYRRTARDSLIAVVGFSVAAELHSQRLAARHSNLSGILLSTLALVLLAAISGVLLRLERNMHLLQTSDLMLGLALTEARELVWHWSRERSEGRVEGDLQTLLGITLRSGEMTLDAWTAAIHPEDRPLVALAWNNHLEGLAAEYQCEYRVGTADGSYRWVLARGRATARDTFGQASHMAGIIIDIDDDKQAQLTIARLHARYQRLIEAAGQGVLVIDRRGCIDLLNPAAERLLGWSQAKVMGQRAHDVVHPETPGPGDAHPWYDCPLYMSLQDGQMRRIDRAIFRRRDGTALPVELTVSPLAADGIVEGAIVLFDDVSERMRYESSLERLARTDTLTGVANRRQFVELGEREVKRSQRDGAPLSALMMDLDHFKDTNDRFGHAVGDRVLVAMASVCTEELREIDIFGRLGGEEFGALLPGVSASEAVAIAERLRQAVEALRTKDSGQDVTTTVSIGIATWQPGLDPGLREVTLDRLLSVADKALYRAKAAGRNRLDSCTL